MWALIPEKMPLAPGAFLFTVNAHNIDQLLKFRRHRVIFDLTSPRFPSSSHALRRDNSLLTERAPVVKTGQLPEAVRVDRVPAGQVLGRLPRAEHVFDTHRARILVLVAYALVSRKDAHADTHAALITVTKCLDSAHSAQSAKVAMERFLAHRHPQVAYAAMVFPKWSMAVHALISGRRRT